MANCLENGASIPPISPLYLKGGVGELLLELPYPDIPVADRIAVVLK